MKKYLALILGVLFVLSFAASAFAIHAEIPAETQSIVAKGTTQITLGGEIRFRGWYYNDLLAATGTSATPGIPNDDAGSAANYDGRVRLNVDAKVSPNVQGFIQIESGTASSDTYTWGNYGSRAGNTKTSSNLDFLQAWIQYTGSGLLGFNSGLKIGHMPLALGERQFFDHTQFGDDAIVFFMDPSKQLHIGLLTIKFQEGTTGDNTNDTDGYVALTTYKINDQNTIGANYTYLNNSDAGLQLSNLGVHAAGSLAGFGYKVEGDYQFGEVADDTDAEGYAVMLGLNYKLNPVNIRASFAYGSGDDNALDEDSEGFNTFVGTIQHYTFVYDYRAVTTAGSTGTGIANTNYYNLGVDFEPTKDIAMSLDGYYIRASETADDVDEDAGWEIDGKITYKLAKNLTYMVNVGYFAAGDFYEDTYGDSADAGATVVNNILTLSF